MRRIKLILAVLFMALASAPLGAEELDMNEYLFGHVGDSYEWHITTVKGHPVSIPLPEPNLQVLDQAIHIHSLFITVLHLAFLLCIAACLFFTT